MMVVLVVSLLLGFLYFRGKLCFGKSCGTRWVRWKKISNIVFYNYFIFSFFYLFYYKNYSKIVSILITCLKNKDLPKKQRLRSAKSKDVVPNKHKLKSLGLRRFSVSRPKL